jgi:hypothetical protein
MKTHWGERNRIFFVLAISLLSVLGWTAFKKFQSLMMLGYVDSAIARVHSIVSAEDQFAKFHPETGFTCALTQLPRGNQITRLLKDGTDNGYAFDLTECRPRGVKKPISSYRVVARPLHSGLPVFCSDQTGILRSEESVSLENCRTSGVPL